MPLLFTWVAVALLTCRAYEAQFDAWCVEHGWDYATPKERATRLTVFVDNATFVEAHNAWANLFALSNTLVANDFMDLTHDEFRGLEADIVGSARNVVDWREKGTVTKSFVSWYKFGPAHRVAVVNHEAVPIVVCATDHPKFMLSARTGVGIEFLRFRLPIMVERASFRRGVVGGGGAGGRGRARAGGEQMWR
jgi:hypothetical protein